MKAKKKTTGESEHIKKLEEEAIVLKEQLARALADYKNLEKRLEEEKKEFIRYANKELLIRLIPALDTLFLAAKYTSDEGVRLTVKTVLDALADVGVEKVKAEGVEFNPELMEAIDTAEGEENMVLEEVRPGFTLGGKLIRPAQVKVGTSKKNSTKDSNPIANESGTEIGWIQGDSNEGEDMLKEDNS